MIKIGIITDAHANFPALKAALAALDQEGCDLVVHTGDAVGIGPHPAEVLERLINRPHTHLLMGNHDEWFAFGLPRPRPSWMSAEEMEHQHWTHDQLTATMQQAVATWPYSLDLAFRDIHTLFCHYRRADDGSGFTPIIKEPRAQDLDRLFSQTEAQFIFYGHHHPMSDLSGRARYINPGALGCNPEPQARFAILEVSDDARPNLRFGSVPYDPHSMFHDFGRRGVPARETILRIFFGQDR
jgi:predicted phosphodiesterase